MDETQVTSDTDADDSEPKRTIVRSALDEIAAEIGVALRDVHLDFPVYLTVPTSGESLATIACPLHPSDTDWASASRIVCRVIGKRLGGLRLRRRDLACAIANPAMV